jgi:hypothetical protein
LSIALAAGLTVAFGLGIAVTHSQFAAAAVAAPAATEVLAPTLTAGAATPVISTGVRSVPTALSTAAAAAPTPHASATVTPQLDILPGWTRVPGIHSPSAYAPTNLPGSSFTIDGSDLLWTRNRSGPLDIAVATTPEDTFQVTAVGHQTTTDDNGSWGVVFRYIDNANFYFATVSEATNRVTVVKRVDGNQSQLKAINVSTFPINPARARLTVRDEHGHLTVLFNSKVAAEIEDGDLTGGQVGMWAFTSSTDSTATFRFMDFEVLVPALTPS